MKSTLKKGVKAAFSVTPSAIKEDVKELRKENPSKSDKQLAKKVISSASWQNGANGFACGLPSNIATALPAAGVDLVTEMKLHVGMGARVATIYDNSFLDSLGGPLKLFVPLMGTGAVNSIACKAGVKSSQKLSLDLAEKCIRRTATEKLYRYIAKQLGKKIPQKGISKFVPVVGGVVGGAINLASTRVAGNRVIDFMNA